jgi:hypothetical protein
MMAKRVGDITPCPGQRAEINETYKKNSLFKVLLTDILHHPAEVISHVKI